MKRENIYSSLYILVFLIFLINFAILPRQPMPFSNSVHLLLLISSTAMALGGWKQKNRLVLLCGISVFMMVGVSWIMKSMV